MCKGRIKLERSYRGQRAKGTTRWETKMENRWNKNRKEEEHSIGKRDREQEVQRSK